MRTPVLSPTQLVTLGEIVASHLDQFLAEDAEREWPMELWIEIIEQLGEWGIG